MPLALGQLDALLEELKVLVDGLTLTQYLEKMEQAQDLRLHLCHGFEEKGHSVFPFEGPTGQVRTMFRHGDL